jgi:hypothetical protein
MLRERTLRKYLNICKENNTSEVVAELYEGSELLDNILSLTVSGDTVWLIPRDMAVLPLGYGV